MDLPPRRTVALVSVTRLRVAGLGALASPVHAAAVINPADQPTIQAAVAAAASGDTILIAPGTYTGGVSVQDKVLTFASWYQTTGNPSYIDQTIVSGYVANDGADFGNDSSGTFINVVFATTPTTASTSTAGSR